MTKLKAKEGERTLSFLLTDYASVSIFSSEKIVGRTTESHGKGCRVRKGRRTEPKMKSTILEHHVLRSIIW